MSTPLRRRRPVWLLHHIFNRALASALVLMTVATGFTKVELSGTGELRIEKQEPNL